MKMRDFNSVANGAQLQIEHARSTGDVRHIALLILEGCPLSDATAVAEMYELVNDVLPCTPTGLRNYSVCMLSTQKGFVSCASAIRLFAENIDDFDPRRYAAIFVGGGNGTQDRRVIDWLAQAGRNAELIAFSADAHDMLDTNGLLSRGAPDDSVLRPDKRANGGIRAEQRRQAETKVPHGERALYQLLEMVERDFGALARIRSEMLRTNRSLANSNAKPTGVRGTNALSERIESAILWMRSNHAGTVSISELARRVSMSERNFLRRFKAEVGQTPHEYLARVRLENAQLLLVQTDLPIDKIARRCGLLNGDHLRKYFLKYLSVTPLEYRTLARDRTIVGPAVNGAKSGT